MNTGGNAHSRDRLFSFDSLEILLLESKHPVVLPGVQHL
jgi:hypothetical protein